MGSKDNSLANGDESWTRFPLKPRWEAFATGAAGAFAAGDASWTRFPLKPPWGASRTGSALVGRSRRARGASRPRRVAKSSSRKRDGPPLSQDAREKREQPEQGKQARAALAEAAIVDGPQDSASHRGFRDDVEFEDWGANGDEYGYWTPGADFQLSPARLAWRVVVLLLLWLWQLPGHSELQQESLAATVSGDVDWVNGTESSDTLVCIKSARAGRALAMSGLLLAANTSVEHAAPLNSAADCAACFLLDFVAARGHVVVPMVSGSWRADAAQQLQALRAPSFFL